MDNVPNPEEQVLNVFDDDDKMKITSQELKTDDKNVIGKDITIPYIDETIGYMLKHEIEQQEGVVFCGIKNPHPLMHQIIFRIVVQKDKQISDIFKSAYLEVEKTLKDLQQLFNNADKEYDQQNLQSQ